MKKEEITVYKYITDDGKEFYSKIEAANHEMSLLYDKVCETRQFVNKFTIYTINNYKELEALFRAHDDYNRIFKPEKIKSYPCMICLHYYSDYGYEYDIIDDIIDQYSDILMRLKNHKETLNKK